ncbi:MAG: acyl-CoA desaturase [Polyangiaceae bacterium]|nr:acyl-CoA desaturase [Polyangiaceae bacterium]
MNYILIFFVAHWTSSVFCQTFFLHRYGAHSMFQMNRFWERFFHLATYITQGPSYLNPRAYAILHRMHHAYSDTEKDPHSPHYFKDVFSMMLVTKKTYDDFAYDRNEPERRFDGRVPTWPALDKLGQNWPVRILWCGGYIAFYYAFAPSAIWYALLPFHFLMGPTHGAIVNWGGHKYGYRNFDNKDKSVNSLFFDFLTFGELFQNNHHKFGMSPKFSARWFEVDPAWPLIRLFDFLGIIKITSQQRMRYPAPVQDGVGEPAAFIEPDADYPVAAE